MIIASLHTSVASPLQAQAKELKEENGEVIADSDAARPLPVVKVGPLRVQG